MDRYCEVCGQVHNGTACPPRDGAIHYLIDYAPCRKQIEYETIHKEPEDFPFWIQHKNKECGGDCFFCQIEKQIAQEIREKLESKFLYYKLVNLLTQDRIPNLIRAQYGDWQASWKEYTE